MLDVVPMYEAVRPGASVVEFGKAFGRKLATVLGGAKQRFRVSVVIASPGSKIWGVTPNQFSIASTVVAWSVKP